MNRIAVDLSPEDGQRNHWRRKLCRNFTIMRFVSLALCAKGCLQNLPYFSVLPCVSIVEVVNISNRVETGSTDMFFVDIDQRALFLRI